MSNAKHTPGPWGTAEVHENRELDRLAATEIVWLENGVTLATLENYAPDERRANARLIAAAPEQNAELVKLADDLHAHTKDGLGATPETLRIWEERVRAAIAKATGSAQ